LIAALGRYEIVAQIGRGAMGVVYRARDPLLGREVAVKTILLPADDAERAEYEARFQQEARAAAALNHPGIVTIHDIGRADGVLYMAMEYVEGHELRDALAGGQALPVPRAVEIAAQLADALGYAHARGIVHRDVKPANVMILRDGRAKIMDFGIARIAASDVKTQTGVLMGSPKYMSPEQVQGRPADARSDLFALGVVLHEMLCGAPPFTGDDVSTLMYNVAHADSPPPSAVNPAVPSMLDLVVARALSKSPERRYADAAQMAADLRACLLSSSHSAAPPDATVALAATTLRPGAAAASDRTLPLRPATVPAARGLARRFDADAALRRLEARIADRGREAAARSSPAPRTPLAARERLFVAAAITISAMLAVILAFR
jgi:serine/threonine-protein kinase